MFSGLCLLFDCSLLFAVCFLFFVLATFSSEFVLLFCVSGCIWDCLNMFVFFSALRLDGTVTETRAWVRRLGREGGIHVPLNLLLQCNLRGRWAGAGPQWANMGPRAGVGGVGGGAVEPSL